jgi:hypothetical protein
MSMDDNILPWGYCNTDVIIRNLSRDFKYIFESISLGTRQDVTGGDINSDSSLNRNMRTWGL